jgi:glycosyltransferase involved in cell wall biosynthesis
MVLLEAMTLRTVVVAHAVGGIPALLDHGKCGVPVEKHTPGAYAGAILALARDDARRERLADAALQRIHDRYSAASNAQATLQEYRALYG